MNKNWGECILKGVELFNSMVQGSIPGESSGFSDHFSLNKVFP